MLESSWGNPERVADCIWDAHTDMQLFIQLDYYGYTLHGLSFTVKPWASREISAMYERSCQAHIWSQCTSCCLFCLSLIACLVLQSSDSQKLNCRACCQWIQLKLSSLLLSFTPILRFGSSPSHSFSRLRWSTHQRGHREIYKKFLSALIGIYGKWSVQASIDAHTRAQCNHASVGLTQACPN